VTVGNFCEGAVGVTVPTWKNKPERQGQVPCDSHKLNENSVWAIRQLHTRAAQIKWSNQIYGTTSSTILELGMRTRTRPLSETLLLETCWRSLRPWTLPLQYCFLPRLTADIASNMQNWHIGMGAHSPYLLFPVVSAREAKVFGEPSQRT
jgi:hypothetical protein